jgi:hypothetical protein
VKPTVDEKLLVVPDDAAVDGVALVVLPDTVLDKVLLAITDMEILPETVAVCVPERDGEGEEEEVIDRVAAVVSDADTDPVAVAVSDTDGDVVSVEVLLADVVLDADSLAVWGGDADTEAVTELDEVIDGDLDGVAVTDGVTLGVDSGACHWTSPADRTGSLSPMLLV